MRRSRSAGFTYLGVLFLVTLLALTAGMASAVWSTAQQRENERQLVFVGKQFQAAIERYAQQTRGPEGRYPRQLEDLLRDPRAAHIRRHLRQLYVDPMTGNMVWGLVRLPDGGIVGVHSLSSRKPLGAAPGTLDAAGPTYRDWRFVAPSAAALLMPGAASAPS